MSENVDSTDEPGNLYEMKFTDLHGNVHICYVSWPEVISEIFQDNNSFDKDNYQLQQLEFILGNMGRNKLVFACTQLW